MLVGYKQMKKALIITILVVVAIGVALVSAFVYARYTSMSEMHLDRPGAVLGPLPMTRLQSVTVAPGLNFRIDTGSSVNTISYGYLKRLKELGMDVDSSTVLTYVRSAVGHKRIATKRYRVTLPVYAYSIPTDGRGMVKDNASGVDTTNLLNRLHGVDFVLVGRDGELPRFGIPILSSFYLEYDHKLRSLRFHPKLPENYVEVQCMRPEHTIITHPRSFFKAIVNGHKHDFMVNTSMPRAGLLFPMHDLDEEPDGKNVFADTIHSVYGDFPSVIDYHSWVSWGDRGGNNVSYFADYGVYPYAVNLFNFLTQDAVFDFKNSRFYVHPYATKRRRTRTNDAFAGKDAPQGEKGSTRAPIK